MLSPLQLQSCLKKEPLDAAASQLEGEERQQEQMKLKKKTNPQNEIIQWLGI